MKGTVKFFNERKNFGFIEPEDKSKDLFVHKNDITSGSLQEGDKVEFDSAEGDKGLKAINVKKLA
ncbi:cold shock domain-containing protein [bacterium]|nr:cold shock domain-containing protein [bacterium]MBU3954990.1 cold shock domain-containing protein [bacterium]MBU4134417.1 cold shock domain-containing protein [bacterium]